MAKKVTAKQKARFNAGIRKEAAGVKNIAKGMSTQRAGKASKQRASTVARKFVTAKRSGLRGMAAASAAMSSGKAG